MQKGNRTPNFTLSKIYTLHIKVCPQIYLACSTYLLVSIHFCWRELVSHVELVCFLYELILLEKACISCLAWLFLYEFILLERGCISCILGVSLAVFCEFIVGESLYLMLGLAVFCMNSLCWRELVSHVGRGCFLYELIMWLVSNLM